MPKKKSLQVIIDQQRDSLDRLMTENERLRRDNGLIHSKLSKENASLREALSSLDEENATLLRRAETAEQNEAKADANAERLQNDVIVGLAAFETAMAENRELRRRILHLHEASTMEFEDKVDALVRAVQEEQPEDAESFADAIREVSYPEKSLYDLPGAPELVLHYKPGDEANATMEKVIKEIEDYSYVKLGEKGPRCGTLVHRGGKYERDIVLRGNKCLSCGVFISDRQQYRSGVQLT